jgi:hypothetical protein
MLINKLLPRWNNSCRISAKLRHIDEFHFAGLAAQAFAQPVGMASHDRDHDSLARREPVFDKWSKYRRVVIGVAPHERFVTITLL